MKKISILAVAALLALSCTQPPRPVIKQSTIQTVADSLIATSDMDAEVIRKGVDRTAALWQEQDGSESEFSEFALRHFARTAAEKEQLYRQCSKALETINGASNMLAVGLTTPTILAGPEPIEIDYLLSGFSPLAHLSDDLFANKIAFIIALNFPEYSLAEKNAHAGEWTRLDWAYARLGDQFTSRVPAEVTQQIASAYNQADNYIADYNIMMGHLLTEDHRRLFSEDMVLLSHWNLRDELKSNYADIPNANEKQETIYQVMQRIVQQDIPACVINDASYDWMPYSNQVITDGQAQNKPAEANVRYQKILDVFHAYLAEDPYQPGMPTAIQRNFEGGMQVSDDEIRSLFTQLIESELVGQVAAIIRERLGRDLRPYDIWYDGFKARASMPEDRLTAETRKRYPTAEAFHQDMPNLLANIGYSAEDGIYYRDHIVVEGARGSGHAWECMSRQNDPARLRTRIGAAGMDYKGYNIAVHEFGHNVEQVTSLYMIDHYLLRGIPNTGFTEAQAFLFQWRDLQLLGYGDYTIDKEALLDIFWSMYEIMGVSLVDMQMWQWLYAHPTANAEQLKQATLAIARDIWNRYYAPVLGETDSSILAIYSHMVNAPMYLPNYPYGHLVHFQLEEHLSQCHTKAEFASELKRIYALGNLTPNAWMQAAVGEDVSVEPVLNAVKKVLNADK